VLQLINNRAFTFKKNVYKTFTETQNEVTKLNQIYTKKSVKKSVKKATKMTKKQEDPPLPAFQSVFRFA